MTPKRKLWLERKARKAALPSKLRPYDNFGRKQYSMNGGRECARRMRQQS